jgi:putative phage-type endonuclease
MSEQRSPDWTRARLGKATASRIADVVATTRSGGYATSRANYAAELACERLTGRPAETYVSAAMRWGVEKEPEARQLYAFVFDAPVQAVGFLDHPTLAMAGASPDGLVGDDGLIEIKCPISATHFETLIGRSAPTRYITQMQWQMAVTGRAWCDYVSYDPRLPFDLQLFVQRIARDEARIAGLEREVRSFLDEVDALVAFLSRKAVEGVFVDRARGVRADVSSALEAVA